MLFGHQDDATQMTNPTVTEPTTSDTSTTDVNPTTDATASPAQTSTVTTPSAPAFDNNPLADESETQTNSPTPDEITSVTEPAATDSSANQSDSTTNGGSDLLGLKQQALGQLTPLVNHLEQSPEEKFRTTMMMIQSTDNQVLLKDAFEAAQAISDDKARAQALLDVINEINYFTQQTKE